MTDQEFLDAAARGDTEAVQAALDAGQKTDTADEHGNTALMMACARSQRDVCKALLAANADTDHKNKFGLGPRDWVDWSDNDSIVRNLL